MLASPKIDFFTSNQIGIQLILGLVGVWKAIRSFLGVFVSTSLFVIANPFLYLILHYIYRLIKKKSNSTSLDSISANNYKTCRVFYDELSSSIEKVRKIQKLSLDGVSWYERNIVKKMLQILAAIDSNYKTVAKIISDMDDVPEGHVLNLIPEKVLWEGRTAAYQYRI